MKNNDESSFEHRRHYGATTNDYDTLLEAEHITDEKIDSIDWLPKDWSAETTGGVTDFVSYNRQFFGLGFVNIPRSQLPELALRVEHSIAPEVGPLIGQN